jgi:hypothetical protein
MPDRAFALTHSVVVNVLNPAQKLRGTLAGLFPKDHTILESKTKAFFKSALKQFDSGERVLILKLVYRMAAAANLMVMLFIARSEDTSSTRPGGYSPDLHATGQKRPVGSWKHFCWLQSISPPGAKLCRHPVQRNAAT